MILIKILKKISPEIGAKIFIEPKWKAVGRIDFKNGKYSYFRFNNLNINSIASAEIAKDKDYANYFMKNLGYSIVPKSKTFFSPNWAKIIGKPKESIDSALMYANKIGFPVIIKPNSGSQGKGVFLVKNEKDFYRAIKNIFKRDKVALIQKLILGKDYRIVVLENKMICAYQRTPLNIIGDGKSDIYTLFNLKKQNLLKNGRKIKININDPRIKIKLNHQKLNLKSIPNKGEVVYLLDNANLSTGGDAVDVTDQIDPELSKIAIKLAQDMNLKLCGVDIIVSENDQYFILEVNASPGLDHYFRIGKKQEKIVENLYLEILKKLSV